ncbi:hypothetical protein ACFFHM_14820 [Halalkalibacter kiskunsagensis]|uniref:Uncharacterized protein n=1 Tax=Halalkalibacter kiskunsagensis TaxID=1548599 RepID=A0ABV6KEI1_9BACI
MKKKLLTTTAVAALTLGLLAACGEPAEEEPVLDDAPAVEDPAGDIEEPVMDEPVEEEPALDDEFETEEEIDVDLEDETGDELTDEEDEEAIN